MNRYLVNNHAVQLFSLWDPTVPVQMLVSAVSGAEAIEMLIKEYPFLEQERGSISARLVRRAN